MNPHADTLSETPRELAVRLLTRIELGGAYADRLLAGSDINALESRDRRFVRELVLGVLRWKLRLDRIIDLYYTNKSRPLDHDIRMILRSGLYQLMFMNSVPDWAAVDESVEIASSQNGKPAAGLVNAILRRFLREGEPVITDTDDASRLSTVNSCPKWLVDRWISRFGIETAERIAVAGTVRHPVSVRANTIKTNAEILEDALLAEGFKTIAGSMPGYFEVHEAGGLFGISAFDKGLFTVQDAAAGMASMLLDPKPGESILDLCAAPGGKATHCAELMDNTGSIDAVDRNKNRLKLVKQTAARLGHDIITCHEGDAATFKNASRAGYDRVLCDVPCTGTGVLSKRPDMKWRRFPDDLPRLAETQFSILANAVSLVKPDGIIVYSTCSLEREENEDVVNRGIDELGLELADDERFDEYASDTGYFILPHMMGGTGAFAAKMRRV